MESISLCRNLGGGDLPASLGGEWRRLLSQLSALGPGVRSCRNEAATLCSSGAYPALHFPARFPGKASNSEAGLWLDSRGLGGARVVHSKQGRANFVSVEFSDTAGRVVHGFDLTPDSDLNAFRKWVRIYQSCRLPVPSKCTGEENSEPAETIGHAAKSGDPGLVLVILKECLRRGIALRVTVSAGPVTQRAVFTPRSLQPVDDWWFASDEAVGLHVRSERIAQVRVTPALGEQYFAAPALYAETVIGAPALILELGNQAQAGEWNAIVHGLV